MRTVNYIEVPSNREEDINPGLSEWRDGLFIGLDEGSHKTLYIGHHTAPAWDGEGNERTATFAFPIRVRKPVTRDRAIAAAEMSAYGLADAEGIASLAASLARKWRESTNDIDVREHDELIAWVKDGLDRIGIGKSGEPNIDTSSPTLADALGLLRATIQGAGLTDTDALRFQSFYPEWETFVGQSLEAGVKLRHGGRLWRVRQAVPVVLESQPPSTATLALYEVIQEGHAGTKDDPIPYEQNMALEQGKYYTQFGVTYLCVQAMTPLPYDLKDVPAHAQAVEG